MGKIHLSQKRYVNELLEKFNMEQAKTVSIPIESNLKITKEMSPTTEEEKYHMKNRPGS
jgi:ATP-binding cassette subfamily B (MDR/TAP) protein 1